VVTTPAAVPRGADAVLPNPAAITSGRAWLVRAPLVRSKRPVSGARSGALGSRGRSNAGAAAGSSVAGGGCTGFAAIGATVTGFGTSAILASCSGGGTGRGRRRGATMGTDGSLTGSAGNVNTLIDRSRGAAGFSDARIGTTIRTIASAACTTTLIQRPALERERGRTRVLNRASLNRTGICRTELKW